MTENIYEGWVYDHLHYAAAHEVLLEEIALALDGGPRIVALLLGISGTGKTELLQDATARFSPCDSGAERSRIRYVSFPPGTTADAVAALIIKKIIGMAIVKGTAHAVRDRAVRVLENSGLAVLILDEANHAAEAHSTRATQTKANRLTADWIKQVVDEAKVSVVMSGLPHSRRLLTDNEQLEGRAVRPIELLPYAWHLEDDREAFRKLVAAFTDRAESCGWRIDVTQDFLVRASYLTSRGPVRPVRRLFERAVILVGKGGTLNASVFARAYRKCFAEKVYGNPFELANISDEMLCTSHRELLQSVHEPIQRDRARKRVHRD